MSRAMHIADPIIAVREYVAEFCGCPLTEVGVAPVTGDASTRQYFRASLQDRRTFIVARYPDPFDPETLNYCDVTRLFQTAGLPIPQLFSASGARAMIIQEDLGDLRLQDWVPNAATAEVEKAYQSAIDLIVRIQVATEMARELDSIAGRLAFDVEKLMWEMDFFLRHYFEGLLHRSSSAGQMPRMRRELEEMVTELASLPRVLCHRDFHARNLMVHRGQLFIIDHQDARLGPTSYDLVSLLQDPYVELGDDAVSRLRDYFVQARSASASAPSSPDWRRRFLHEYHLMAAQRLLKCIGTYAYQTSALQNDVYTRYIPAARRGAIAALKAIDHFPALQATLLEVEGA